MTTKNQSGHFWSLTGIAADYDLGAVESIAQIQFTPGATTDGCIIREYDSTGASGPVVAGFYCTTLDPQVKAVGRRVRLIIDYAGSTLTAGARVDIQTD